MTTLPDIAFESLREMMKRNGVVQLLVKELAANDNAKNQLYLSKSLESSNILPMGQLRAEKTDSGRVILKAPMQFYWLQPNGGAIVAPNSQAILYPQYPEVRISGFLRGAINAPNELLNKRGEGRLLFLGITGDRKIIAWAAGPATKLAKQYRALGNLEKLGVFFIAPLSAAEIGISTRELLVRELCRIHRLNWIASKALDSDGSTKACNSSHCVGYTLEAELGVARNGKSEPDYKGWEIKAGIVSQFGRPPTAKAITLMTPEPTGGYYKSDGVPAFIRKFGYSDKKGRIDRMNFGGVFRAGKRHDATKLTLELYGFDADKGAITQADGALALVADGNTIAAEWSFAALMSLWNRKHAQAAYVPAQSRLDPYRQYRYDSLVRIAVGTNFTMLLSAIASGQVYYDPGIKLENASTQSPKSKRRSQFRTSSRALTALYTKMESIDVCAN